MNPRYEAYLRTNPETPSMIGYMAWIRERWTEWRFLNCVDRNAPTTPKMHAQFDKWLGAV